jgi:molybdopterin converting factor subunit 1
MVQVNNHRIQITVLFFATIRDHMKTRRIDLELPPGSSVVELRKTLTAQFPEAAAALDNALVSINREYAFGEKEIPDGAEVAFFPHVSGG